MTREEAIGTIENAKRFTYGDKKFEEAFDLAIKALRKQKTAKRINISGTDCQCSNCMSWNDLMDKYCWQCGAKMGR